MRFVIDGKTILSQEPTGPVAPYIEQFAGSLREQGYCAYSVYRQVLLAASFCPVAQTRRILLRSITSNHGCGICSIVLNKCIRAPEMLRL